MKPEQSEMLKERVKRLQGATNHFEYMFNYMALARAQQEWPKLKEAVEDIAALIEHITKPAPEQPQSKSKHPVTK